MRWKRGHKSKHVDDLRGQAPARGGGGLGGSLGGLKGLGAGGAVIAVIAVLILGPDALNFLGGGQTSNNPGAGQGQSSGAQSGQGQPETQQQQPKTREQLEEDKLAEFTNFVIDDIHAIWGKHFPRFYNRRYEPARLTLFTGRVSSACGMQSAAVGPFYCPADNKAYIDLAFYRELKRRFSAPGDFAQAYVIAHEVGHHIQNLVGTSGEVHRAQRGASKREANALSIRLELQADCLAGVWAHYTDKNGTLEPGDIDEGIRAAKAIGDDNIQRQATGTVSPEGWTHGSSEQRVRWFNIGFKAGNTDSCDTFSARRL